MNKLVISAVIACGLWLLDSPVAAAHGGGHKPHRDYKVHYSDGYRREAYSRHRYHKNYYGVSHKRAKRMPRWLRHDRSFRRWYDRTRLRKNYRLSWYELFDIYRWEHSYDRRRRY